MFAAIRLQHQMIISTLGTSRWTTLKVKEAERFSQKKERKQSKKKMAEYEQQNLILQRMGRFNYYFKPWKRRAVLKEIKKLQKIEKEIEKKLRDEVDFEEDDRKLRELHDDVF